MLKLDNLLLENSKEHRKDVLSKILREGSAENSYQYRVRVLSEILDKKTDLKYNW